MADLVDGDLVVVRRHGSGSKSKSAPTSCSRAASRRCRRQARSACSSSSRETLEPFPNPMRVEGHTDNRPINTPSFPSNWELSAARAASVVHLFTRAGMDPARLAVVGLGENRPVAEQATPRGRNANRRVVLVILGGRQAGRRLRGRARAERGAAGGVPTALPQPATTEASLEKPPTPQASGRLP